MAKSWEMQRIVAETGSTRTILPGDHSALFTNRGGGACTWTLPAVADVQAGWWVEFFIVAAGDQVYTAPTDKLTAFNDATATTLTIGTNGEEIGNGVRIVFDGTTYLAQVMAGQEAATFTIA